jgi:two-component system NtrC family sensor kinase
MIEEGKADSERRLKVVVTAQDNSVTILFQDSGPGLKEPHRIFEPFYTTKSIGKGTGLGLSICYGLVKEHGGEISARNAEGGGAIIEVKLPAAGHAAMVAQPAARPQKHEAALQGRILVVEDEESVLEFERDVLEGAGAKVVTASTFDDMKSALASDAFDAVIINGNLPGASDVQELCHWISEKYPSLSNHFLLTFSSLAKPEVKHHLEDKYVPFLVKPFEVSDLIANTRKLLVKTQAAAAH